MSKDGSVGDLYLEGRAAFLVLIVLNQFRNGSVLFSFIIFHVLSL